MLTEKQKELVEANMGLAYYCAHQMKNIPIELEDRISLALFGLVKAAGHYRPETGTKFSTYAIQAMQNEIKMQLRRDSKHFGVISLSYPIGDENHREGTLEDMVPDKRDYSSEQDSFIDAGIVFVKLNSLFSGRKQELYMEILRNPGMDQKFYGKRLGMSQSYISRLMKQMREDASRGQIC